MLYRVQELHYIFPISNVASVLEHGLLSHNAVYRKNIIHDDISMTELQDRRKSKVVPNGLPLHDYVNIYFHARNPMLFKRKNEVCKICILQISKEVLDLPNVVITDQNAGSDYVRFMVPGDLNKLDFDKIYAEFWTHPDSPTEYWRHSSLKCAEVLVPESVGCKYIQGAYVADNATMQILIGQGFENDKISINPQLFFR